ncbi:4-carboxy-4-hydroxy-2-oxoadipate aldolase/oxaloacetate decarboxylase [Alicyclobacillus fastidiosus]|uniref:Putative 4-hydroxy-4-methyl-2-oxoglutarate aldolase n=1 Tax=Alicyclobacillus fastidiosus TaxID=392011 RepID=A0ABY6ZJH7_9BACL|nr:4-carboxy-4-hydroxy-2-oxoadipate aldolase/oxaloacetate decarboxylase [Alicyclobacillus fastidiosus]WAH43080.1 4-carboxy-4-hydroxy-2-oxoadipate aldolase/oxaloacetate decarboxylase [Alicyclobacillus fastidiosus]GMA65069.1 methyltransferase [Alicyclobacillus fastidiosus]
MQILHSDEELLNALSTLPSSTVHEAAGRIGNLPSQIKPVSKTMKLCGFAMTVLSPPGDNLWLHRAIYQATPGDILVVDVGTAYEYGYWGEIMTKAAIERGIGGLVINGCVRDLDRLVELDFPIFARGICINGTGKDDQAQSVVNSPARIGDVIVFPGDLVLGDSDGVVVIPRKQVSRVAELAKAREEKELKVMLELRQGKSTLEIYNL